VARTAEGATLTRRHRQQQLALRAATLRDLLRLWPLWAASDVASYDRFVTAARVLVRARHRDAAGLAAGYFQAFRTVERVGGEAGARLAERLAAEQVEVSLRATGLAGTVRALRAGFPAEAAKRSGFVQVSGSVGRLVLNGARDTVLSSIGSDRRALGWHRITASKACSFCAMVAGRGAVFNERTARFEAHDHCACIAEPLYDGSAAPARNRVFEQQWVESTQGLSGAEARAAFRRSYEGISSE